MSSKSDAGSKSQQSPFSTEKPSTSFEMERSSGKSFGVETPKHGQSSQLPIQGTIAFRSYRIGKALKSLAPFSAEMNESSTTDFGITSEHSSLIDLMEIGSRSAVKLNSPFAFIVSPGGLRYSRDLGVKGTCISPLYTYAGGDWNRKSLQLLACRLLTC